MANKMEVIKRWFGESPERRIVHLIETAPLVFTNTLVTVRENVSMLRVLASDLDILYPSTMSVETLRVSIVVGVERAFRAEEQRTYAKEAK